METINYTKERDTFLGWAFIYLITDYKERTNLDFLAADTSQLEIEIKVNGQEMSFLGLIKRLEEAWQHHVDNNDQSLEAKARELLEERCGEVKEIIDQIESFAKDRLAGLTLIK